jgi:hypothetical protein
MATLKEMVAGTVRFAFYKDGELWYRTDVGGFEFPIKLLDWSGGFKSASISEDGRGVFMAEDKGSSSCAGFASTWRCRKPGAHRATMCRRWKMDDGLADLRSRSWRKWQTRQFEVLVSLRVRFPASAHASVAQSVEARRSGRR